MICETTVESNKQLNKPQTIRTTVKKKHLGSNGEVEQRSQSPTFKNHFNPTYLFMDSVNLSVKTYESKRPNVFVPNVSYGDIIIVGLFSVISPLFVGQQTHVIVSIHEVAFLPN